MPLRIATTVMYYLLCSILDFPLYPPKKKTILSVLQEKARHRNFQTVSHSMTRITHFKIPSDGAQAAKTWINPTQKALRKRVK